MKNANENYVEYARVITMCKGTKFENEPWKCVKVCGIPLSKHPFLTESTEGYSFAVAILEGKPVFVGDKLYHEGCPTAWYTVREKGYSLRDEALVIPYDWEVLVGKAFSWNPPKKTFLLNGVELPRPSKTGKVSFGFASDLIGFESYSDAEKVASAIKRILEDATKC